MARTVGFPQIRGHGIPEDAAGAFADHSLDVLRMNQWPGCLLVNVGDLLARWTDDRWRSTMHRVLPPTDERGRGVRRRSAAYVHDGNRDAEISALPGCVPPGAAPRYPPTTVGRHLAEKRAGSRAGRPPQRELTPRGRPPAGRQE